MFIIGGNLTRLRRSEVAISWYIFRDINFANQKVQNIRGISNQFNFNFETAGGELWLLNKTVDEISGTKNPFKTQLILLPQSELANCPRLASFSHIQVLRFSGVLP